MFSISKITFPSRFLWWKLQEKRRVYRQNVCARKNIMWWRGNTSTYVHEIRHIYLT